MQLLHFLYMGMPQQHLPVTLQIFEGMEFLSWVQRDRIIENWQFSYPLVSLQLQRLILKWSWCKDSNTSSDGSFEFIISHNVLKSYDGFLPGMCHVSIPLKDIKKMVKLFFILLKKAKVFCLGIVYELLLRHIGTQL